MAASRIEADDMGHLAVAQLRRAVAAALKKRDRRIAELDAHYQSLGYPWKGPNWGPYWRDFAQDGFDLSRHADGAPQVSPEGALAALDVLEAICAAAPLHDSKVAPSAAGGALRISCGDLKAQLSLRERFVASELKRDAPGGGIHEETKSGSGRFIAVIEGLGRTPLKIEGTPEELQRLADSGALFDRMRQRAVSAGQQEAALATKRQRQQREAAEASRLRDEERRLRAAAVEEAALESGRRDQLLREALASEQAEIIRRYVARAAAAGADLAWVEWALQRAADIDPLSGK